MDTSNDEESIGLLSIKLKRRLTYGTIFFFNLCTGLGYAIIFPTIWNYIQHLGGQEYMLGIVISSYSLSSLFANPAIGWWSDKSLNTRLILLVTIMAEAVGSLLYFVGVHTWILVIGRLIAGIGAGGGAAVIGDVTRTTSIEDRTPVLAMVIASRQLGLIIGPAFNLFLSKLDFYIFSLPVNKYTSPGIFMAVVWLLLEFAVVFTYHNLTSLRDDEDVEKLFHNYNAILTTGSAPYGDLDNVSNLDAAFTSSYPPYTGGPTLTDGLAPGPLAFSVSHPNLQVEWFEGNDEGVATLRKEEIETINCQRMPPPTDRPHLVQSDRSPLRRVRKVSERAGSVSDRMIESAERVIQSVSGSYANFVGQEEDSQEEKRENSAPSGKSSTYYSSDPFPDEKSSLLGSTREDYFRDEIVVLLGLGFISCFAQTVLETIVTPLAQRYYNFTEMENSFIYLFAGVEVILVFAALKFISRKASDRSLILFGLFTLGISMVLPILYIPSAVPGGSQTLVYPFITLILDLIGIAMVTVCSSSLLSKLTGEDSQALLQGLRRSMVSLGCIMGPLWGGAYLFNIYFLFFVPVALTVLIAVLFMLSYKRLNVERL